MTCRKCVLTAIAIYAATLGFIYFAVPAKSQGMCGPYKEFVRALQGSKYAETSIGKGLSGGGTMVIETFASKETFTILATTISTGRTCIIAAGKSWVAETEIPGEPT